MPGKSRASARRRSSIQRGIRRSQRGMHIGSMGLRAVSASKYVRNGRKSKIKSVSVSSWVISEICPPGPVLSVKNVQARVLRSMAPANLSNSTPSGERAQASTSGTSANTHAAETCIGNRPQETLGGSLATQSAEGADYSGTNYMQQATHESEVVPAQVQGKTPQSLTRKQGSREAREAAVAAEAALAHPV